ncbi:hypothetical protein CEXT_609191 [Caerostris extrusa]|uniref:Uncharacterized protein n=1 Tax=Caerostris extrusa TaxID=172846 RepID=A0AAV4P4D2_CAEEX|nr:hypothetical protein CEXT_609191 [Caerostris extrusa]
MEILPTPLAEIVHKNSSQVFASDNLEQEKRKETTRRGKHGTQWDAMEFHYSVAGNKDVAHKMNLNEERPRPFFIGETAKQAFIKKMTFEGREKGESTTKLRFKEKNLLESIHFH